MGSSLLLVIHFRIKKDSVWLLQVHSKSSKLPTIHSPNSHLVVMERMLLLLLLRYSKIPTKMVDSVTLVTLKTEIKAKTKKTTGLATSEMLIRLKMKPMMVSAPLMKQFHRVRCKKVTMRMDLVTLTAVFHLSRSHLSRSMIVKKIHSQRLWVKQRSQQLFNSNKPYKLGFFQDNSQQTSRLFSLNNNHSLMQAFSSR